MIDKTPEYVAYGLAAHDGSGRKRASEVVRTLRFQELDGDRIRLVEPCASGRERGDGIDYLSVLLEIQIEPFGTANSVDEPLDGLCGMGDLLGRRVGAFAGDGNSNRPPRALGWNFRRTSYSS